MSPDPGSSLAPMAIGSPDHATLFCRMLLDTHNPYRVEALVWPALAEAERQRVIGLPIWDLAIQTEGDTSLRVATFAETIQEPLLLRQAVELNGFEEKRHKQLLAGLVAAYGIPQGPEPAYVPPRDAEFAFIATGYSECLDSFFAFGLFEAAKRSGFFPLDLVAVFEPIMQEEARHILFFVNWVAWRRKTLPLWRRPLFRARILQAWIGILWERAQAAREVGGGSNFLVEGHATLQIEMNFRDILSMCLEEHERRLAPYDLRLLRPRLVPRLASFALKLMGGFGQAATPRPALAPRD